MDAYSELNESWGYSLIRICALQAMVANVRLMMNARLCFTVLNPSYTTLTLKASFHQTRAPALKFPWLKPG